MSEYDRNNNDEIMHYGVEGMRWGVRRASYYDNRASIDSRKVSTAKTKIGKLARQNAAEINKYYAQRARDIKSTKGPLKTLRVDSSFSNASKSSKAAANIYNNQAKASRTKLYKQANKVAAKNASSESKYYKDIADAKGIRSKASKIVKGYYNQKVTNLSGRTTSRGRAIVEHMVPGLTTVKNIGYMRSHKGEFGKVN